MPGSFLGVAGLLADCPAGDRRLIGMENARIQEAFCHERRPSGCGEISGHKFPPRLQIGEQWHAAIDEIKVIDAEIDPGLFRDGQQMQHGIR